MSDIQMLTNLSLKFRKERDWEKFHNPKDVALSLVLEATEVLEHFQWKNEAEVKEYIKTNKEDIADELADTLNYLLMLCHDLKIDIVKSVLSKNKKNQLKYPVEKSKGKNTKYNKL